MKKRSRPAHWVALLAALATLGGLTTVEAQSSSGKSKPAKQPTTQVSISPALVSGSTADLSLNQGVPWNNSTLITTGSGYDVRSGRMIRRVTDFSVAGSVGDQPLRQQRVATTDAQSHINQPIAETVWSMTPYDYRVLNSSSTFANFMYPDGTYVSFGTASTDGVTTLTQASGGSDRVVIDGSGNVTTLWLGDGTCVLFTGGRATQIKDKYGLALTVSYGSDGISQVTDASGRYISYTWYTVPGTSLRVIRHATGSDGQWAQYTWDNNGLSGTPRINAVAYNDGTSASYTYTDKGVPDVLSDTRANARMQSVKYYFGGRAIDGVTTTTALAVMEECDPTTLQFTTTRDISPVFNSTPPAKYQVIVPCEEYRGDEYTRTFSFSWDHVTGYVGANGEQVSFGYDSLGRINSITDPNGHVTQYVNESATGKPTKVTYADGTYAQLSFSSAAYPYFPATRTDELGRVTTYSRFANGVIQRIDYPDGGYETWSGLTAFNQPTSHRLTNGATEWWDYDSSGRLLKHWLPSSNGQQTYTSYTYYPSGHAWQDRVQNETDPRGNVTTYEYDLAFSNGVQGSTPCPGRGLVTKITHADGTYQSFGYDMYGDKVWEENELRQRTTFTYDNYQRVLTVTDPAGGVTTNDYTIYVPDSSQTSAALSHATNHPGAVTSPSGRVTRFYYDGNFNVVRKVAGYGTADATITNYTYDAAGNLTQESQQVDSSNYLTTTYDYDVRNRKRHAYAPLSRTTEWQYDSVGNVVKTINPDGTYTTKDYDSMNRPLHATDELSHVTAYAYYPSGKVQWVIDANNNSYSYWYDDSNRPTYFWLTNAGQNGFDYEQTAYDAAGNVSNFRNRSGSLKSFTYDNRNRETATSWNDGVTPSTTTGYDSASRVTSRNNGTSSLGYTYDAAGRLTSETQAVAGTSSRSVNYTYDADGNRLTLISGSYSLGYGYSNRGQLTAINWGGGGSAATYTYRLDGRRRFRTLGNGTTTDYNYDGAGRLNYLHNYRTSDGSWLEMQQYGYDQRDRRTWSQRNQNLGDTYAYQADGRLTDFKFNANSPSTTPSSWAAENNFAYDSVGNRTSVVNNGTTVSYATDHANQYTSVSGATIAYGDGRGNATQWKNWTYTYDAENRLISAAAPGTTITFAYDASDRLAKRVINGQNEYLLYDGVQMLMRYGDGNALLESTVWGQNPDEALVGYQPSTGYYYYHADVQGNTLAVTDGNRNVLEYYLYDAYGNVSFFDGSWNGRSSSTYGIRYLFTGQEWMAAAGLYNYKHRDYAPDLGRFLQSDPKRLDAGDLNLYRYCTNDPFGRLDPLGMASEAPNNTAGVNGSTLLAAGMVTTVPGILPTSTGGILSTVGQALAGAGRWVLSAVDTTVLGPLGAILMLTPTTMGNGELPRPTFDQTTLTLPNAVNAGRTPATGVPNSVVTFPDGTTRIYGSDGKAVIDIDSGHDHTGAGDPHSHPWDWTQPQPRQPPQPVFPIDPPPTP